MKAMICEMCNSNDIIKQDGLFVCQSCGTKYSIEEARKLLIEGTVDVSGSAVKIDNSDFIAKWRDNAIRAYSKEDWEEVEKYFNLIEQNTSNNMEAVFFSAYGKAMLSLYDQEYFKREQKFKVLIKSISVINDYYELTTEDKKHVLKNIGKAITKMFSVNFVYNTQAGYTTGGMNWQNKLLENTRDAFITELREIAAKHNEAYIQELITQMSALKKGGCYVATAIYGSYDCPQVWTLRRFRDDTLGVTWYGRLFIHAYYAVSPTLVKWFGDAKWFKNLWKPTLDKMVFNLNDKGIENTPYNDRHW